MKLFGSLVIAFSMYSKIPMPRMEWTKERMKYAMCFFPLVGAVQGICLVAFLHLMNYLGLEQLGRAGGVALPILLNGGIHMDGFLDVVDARSSYGDREKKLEILKDPHTGAFAIIGGGVYLLLYYGVFGELPMDLAASFGSVYVLTRALSGLSVVAFPKAKNSGLAAAFSDDAQKQAVAVTMAVYLAVCLWFLVLTAGPLAAGVCMAAAAGVYGYYYRMSVREFGGITGDLAGYFLQVCELVLLLALVLTAAIFG